MDVTLYRLIKGFSPLYNPDIFLESIFIISNSDSLIKNSLVVLKNWFTLHGVKAN